MLKPILTLSILFATTVLSIAQSSNLLTEAEDKTISINYDNSDLYSDGVLDIIAVTQGPKVISYSIKEHREIIKNGSQLMVRVYVGNLLRTDDYTYQQFDINDFLTPSLISFTYEFKGENGDVLKTENISKAIFKSGAPLVKFSYHSFGGEESSTIALSDITFSFSKKDLKTLDQYIQTINSYYDVDAQLSLMNQELDQLAIDSIELLNQNLYVTQENDEALGNIKSLRFASKLHLAANDPLSFKSNFGQTDVSNTKIKKELEHQIKYMHATYHKKGISYLTWGDTAMAISMFESSIEEKKTFAPPYYELANIDFTNNKYQKAIDSCQMIISKLKPDNDTRYQVVKLAESVIYIYIDSIHLLIENKEFDVAVKKLNQTLTYAEQIEGVKTFSEFNAIYTQLYQAYYNQLVEKTEALLEEKSLNLAHQNIDSLSRLRTTYQKYIVSAEKEYVLQNQLYQAWIDHGKAEKELGLINNALMAFTKAKSICQTYDKVLCTEEHAVILHQAQQDYYGLLLVDAQKAIDDEIADSALNILTYARQTLLDWKLEPNPLADTLWIDANQIKYDDLVYEGDIAMGNYNTRQALAFYNEALALSQQLPLNKNELLADKISDAATASVIMYCDHGSTQIDALQIEKAYFYLEKAKTLATHYQIMTNPEVSIAIEILEAALNAGECNKAVHEFNVQFNTAKKLIEYQNFSNANKALDKSISIVKNHEECTLSDSAAIDLKEQIRPIKTYVKYMDKTELLIEQNSFNGAIENYQIATNYFNDSVTNTYNFQHIVLFDYIKNNRSNGLKDFAIRYYTEQKDTEKGLDLLYQLYKVDYNNNWSKKSQIALGVQLAQDDFKEDPNQSVDRKLLEYTKNDKWFNHLKKAYLSQWKKL